MVKCFWIGWALAILAGPALAQDQARPFATFDTASDSVLNDPHDLEFGPDGRLYVADKFGHRIVVMDPDTLEIVAVMGDGAFPGIHDIAFGPDGLAYVAVTGGSRVDVVRIDRNQAIVERSLYGLTNIEGAEAHSNGRVYAMASGTGQLVMFEGKEAQAVEEAPDGSIWVADNVRGQIVHFDADLNLLGILGREEFGFIGPRYLEVDDAGRLIIADQDAHRVLLIDPAAPEGNRLIGVLGDGTPGKGPGKFDDPEGVAIQGNRYFFADSDNDRIVRYVVILN